MADSTILREYLLKLGYEEDEPSRKKFTESLASMTTMIAGLGAAVVAATAGVINGVEKMAEGMAQLGFVSQRTKSSVADIRAGAAAFTAAGGSVAEYQGAIESLAKYVRSNPGHKQQIEAFLGGPGTYKDATQGLNDLAKSFNHLVTSGKMDYAVMMQLWESLGQSEHTFLTLTQKDFPELEEEYRRIAKSFLGNQDEMAHTAHQYELSFLGVFGEHGTIASAALAFGETMEKELKPQLDHLREWMINHADEIKTAGESVAKSVGEIGRQAEDAFVNAEKAAKSIKEMWGAATADFGKEDKDNPLKAIEDGLNYTLDLSQNLGKKGHEAIMQFLHDQGGIGHFYTDFIANMKWAFGIVSTDAESLTERLLSSTKTWTSAMLGWIRTTLDAVKNIVSGVWGEISTSRLYKWMSGDSSETGNSLIGPGGESTGASKPGIFTILEYLKGYFGGDKGTASGGGNKAVDTNDPRVKAAYDQLIEEGRSPSAASGIVANMYNESGMDHTVTNASGHSGLGQWSLDRQQRFHEYLQEQKIADHSLRQSSFREQVSFYNWELKRYEKEANAILERAQTPEEGARGGLAFERPEGYVSPDNVGPMLFPRARDARKIQMAMGGQTGSYTPPDITTGYDIGAWTAGVLPGGQSAANGNNITIHNTNHFSTTGSDPHENAKTLATALSRTTADTLRNSRANVI